MHAFAFFLERSIDLRAVQALYPPIFVKVFFYLKSVSFISIQTILFPFSFIFASLQPILSFRPYIFQSFSILFNPSNLEPSMLLLGFYCFICVFLLYRTNILQSFTFFFSIFSILSKPFSLFFVTVTLFFSLTKLTSCSILHAEDSKNEITQYIISLKY